MPHLTGGRVCAGIRGASKSATNAAEILSIPCGIILIVIGWKDRNQQRNCWRVVKGKRLASGTVRGLEIHGLYVWIFCVKEKKIFLDFTIHLASLKLFTKKNGKFYAFYMLVPHLLEDRIRRAERTTDFGRRDVETGGPPSSGSTAGRGGGSWGGRRTPARAGLGALRAARLARRDACPGVDGSAAAAHAAPGARAPARLSREREKKTQRTPAGPAWRSLSVGAP